MVLLGQLEQCMQQGRSYYNSQAQRLSRASLLETYRKTCHKSLSKQRTKKEIRAQAARKHSEAEKRRRLRINVQYAVLRDKLPNILRKDKASLLGESIKQVEELLNNVATIEENSDDLEEENVFPNVNDDLAVEKCNDEQGLVKATLSCEDRPGLMLAISRAVAEVKAKVVKAEMVMMGERFKSVLWIQYPANENVTMLKRVLKVVMQKPSFKMRSLNIS
ncbi:transcription factor bHLH131-like [Gastrolobium bilobum]|uniref:transcription factor bHLH131-like n=1 Tax=Gastrolobium bilobum TaxID=150636 RepID=UPI002AB20DC5|nr:transcription factor bHLH131-like [Gastrolobium bilobum]